MLGFNYIKSSPSHYLLHFRDGRVVREGAGLSFFYFAPSATLVRVPLNAVELPFMFEDVTRDFQTVTLQGQVVYRVADPRKLAERQDFSIDARGQHLSDDPQKLVPRVLNTVKAQFRALLQGLDLPDSEAFDFLYRIDGALDRHDRHGAGSEAHETYEVTP